MLCYWAAASVGPETLGIRKEKKHWLLNHIERVTPNFVHPVRSVKGVGEGWGSYRVWVSIIHDIFAFKRRRYMDKTFLSYCVTSTAVKVKCQDILQLGLNKIGQLPSSCTAFPQAFTINPFGAVSETNHVTQSGSTATKIRRPRNYSKV